MDRYDVIIVGGGPGGLNAALVLARARRHVLVIDDRTYRNKTVSVFHGFSGRDGTDPARLRADARTELDRYGVEIAAGPAFAAARDFDGSPVLSLPHRQVSAEAIVMATGVQDELPPIAGLRARWGRSVFSCPFCDGWEHRDRPVAVISAADGAEHLAALLRTWTADVTLVPTEDIRRLVGPRSELQALELIDGSVVPADAIFLKAPVRPRSDLAAGLGCRLDDHGYIVTNTLGATTCFDVWAVGDVRRPPPLPHQAVLAAADGNAAAIDIHRTLHERSTKVTT